MTPKEKADELVNKFTPHTKVFHEHLGWVNYLDSTKQCALIAVNEMLEELDHLAFDDFDYGTSKMMYWIEVKREIENYKDGK
jgi:hypothetical protein